MLVRRSSVHQGFTTNEHKENSEKPVLVDRFREDIDKKSAIS